MTKREENIEEQILEAAFAVFVEKGFNRSKMQDIADKAGISRTVLNYYFRSKDLLYQQSAKSIMQQALPNILRILNGDMEFEDKIKTFVDTYIDLSIKNPFMPLFIVNELNNMDVGFVEKLLNGVVPKVDPFLDQIKSEIKKGNIVEINPIQLFVHIISLCAYPFLAKPVIMLVTGLDEEEFKGFIEERKKEVKRLVLKGIKS